MSGVWWNRARNRKCCQSVLKMRSTFHWLMKFILPKFFNNDYCCTKSVCVCSFFPLYLALTPCQRRASAERLQCGRLRPGCFITSCNEDGTFPSKQCQASSGYCHCEDESGNLIPGTEHRRFEVDIDCDKRRGNIKPKVLLNTKRACMHTLSKILQHATFLPW